MPPSRATCFFHLVVCLGLFTGCWEGISRRVVGIVLSVRGEVVYRPPGTSIFHNVTPETKPGVGSTVQIPAEAGLDLELLPGAILRISENSELKIEELKLTKDGNETAGGTVDRIAQIRLTRGAVTVYFQQPGGAEGRVGIVTDRVTFNAKPGSLFQIETDASKTRVTTAAGEVYASLEAGVASTIKEGYFQQWPSEQLGPMLAAGDSRGQEDLAKAVQAGKELDDEEGEHPSYIPWRAPP